jgi:formylglycine-generating enzyme required for sulfatase activity
MTAGLRTWVVGALAAFVAVCAQAQDLKDMKGLYENNAEVIRSGFQPKFDGLQQQYQKALEALKTRSQSRGDFKTTKAAADEIGRFQKTKSLPATPDEAEIPEIKALQAAYTKQFSVWEMDMTAKLGALTVNYGQALDRLLKEQTKAGKLDEAAAVNQELEKAQAAIRGYAETLASLKGSAATNATVVAASPAPAMVTGKPAGKQDLYMVIDLSRGTKAAKGYPVTYFADVPKGGWNDEYKTDKLVLRRIEPGTFTMGSPEDELGHQNGETQHEVTLTQPFYIGVFEMTQKQWERVMGDWPSQFKNVRYRDDRPVENVSYNDIRGAVHGANWPSSNSVDAASFMGRLRARTGKMFDLPTEAQWEYACRAGAETALNTGKNLTDKEICPNMAESGRYKGNSGDGAPNGDTRVGTAEVGSYPPNAWGLYDLHGNVWEWCLDWRENYSGKESDPRGSSTGSDRMARGGGWYHRAYYCRSAYRGGNTPDFRCKYIGIRAVLFPGQQ